MNEPKTRPDGLVEGWKVFAEHGHGSLWSAIQAIGAGGIHYPEGVWCCPITGDGPLTYFASKVAAEQFCISAKGVVRRVLALPWIGERQLWHRVAGIPDSLFPESFPHDTALAAAIKVLPEEKAEDLEARVCEKEESAPGSNYWEYIKQWDVIGEPAAMTDIHELAHRIEMLQCRLNEREFATKADIRRLEKAIQEIDAPLLQRRLAWLENVVQGLRDGYDRLDRFVDKAETDGYT